MFRTTQNNKFSEIDPNVILSDYITQGNELPDSINNIGLTPGFDSVTDIKSLFKSKCPSKNILDMDSTCRKENIDYLLSHQDPDEPLRCGWLYKKGNSESPFPKVSSGYIGNSSGPLDFTKCHGGSAKSPAADAKWYWNLEEAKKQMDIDRCGAMKSCSSLSQEIFKGCGYDTNRAYGVPINDKTPSNVIRSADKCPRPTPAEAARDLCYTTTGKLSRNCVLQQLRAANCSEDGALYTALKDNFINRFIDEKYGYEAYKIYQARAGSGIISGNMLRDGSTTTEAALQTFSSLYDNAISPANNGLAYAARDLCLSAGTLEKFDFCSEISDDTRPPFIIKCLQEAFLKAGGTLIGEWYPSSKNMGTVYMNFRNWGEVKKAWSEEMAYIGTTHPNKERALKRMKGININGLPVVRL